MKNYFYVGLFLILSTKVFAADFTIQVNPSANSVDDSKVSSLSISKITDLQSSLDDKASQSSVDSALTLKADLTVVANWLLQKADVSSLSAYLLKSENPTSRRNLIINGNFSVNQRGHVSGNVIASGSYAHDRWKTGSSTTYTFTSNVSGQTINISSGSLIQVVEDRDLAKDSYVLSWEGTSQARIGLNSQTPSGGFSSSPIIITGKTPGQVMSVEFSTGTLGKVMLNEGSVVAPFEVRQYSEELRLAQRFYYEESSFTLGADGYCPAAGGYLVVISHKHPVPMRTSPTMTMPNFTTQGNLNPPSFETTTLTGTKIIAICNTVGRMILGGGNTNIKANAEY